mgnify:CR=1 FL=1
MRHISITTKFILSFLFIAIVPLSIATKISYDSSRDALVEEITNSLFAVADNKVNQIATYLYEKERNATSLSHMSDVVDAAERFEEAVAQFGAYSPEYIAVDNEFRPFFAYYQKSFDYSNLFLVNPDGDVIFAVKGQRKIISLYEMALYQNSQMAKVFVQATKSLKTEISDFEYDPDDGGVLFIASPILKGSQLIGVIVLQMNNGGVSKLVQNYTSLGETGEVILIARMGDKATFISPIRFDPNAAFKRKILLGSDEAVELQEVVQGKESSGTLIDYRKNEVISVLRYIPSFRWGMVVKMDTEEVIASADRLRWTLYKISFGLLIVVIIMAVAIARSMSRPIKELTKISGTIAGGNFSARAKVHGNDEIGTLALSFNEMTNKLVEAKSSVEQKKAELEQQHELLEEANRELDSFTHTVSHDLQAPLRGVASFATFLEEDYKDKLDEEGKEYLKEIREGTTRMSTLIQDLLALSRITRIKNPFEEVDINVMIEAVCKRIEFDINKHEATMNINKSMPTIICDRIKLTEVFLNLINNAIKFSSKQEKKPVVDVQYEDQGEMYQFSVKDNGIGIAPENQDKVFGIFKRLHTNEEFEGSGAGLGIVKKVVDDHNGKVWIESEVGKGTKFLFTIPKNLEIGQSEEEEKPAEDAQDEQT